MIKKDFKLSAIPKEPNNIFSKNPTKSTLFLKWKRWFANHPTTSCGEVKGLRMAL
jgi:hypothetical protein